MILLLLFYSAYIQCTTESLKQFLIEVTYFTQNNDGVLNVIFNVKLSPSAQPVTRFYKNRCKKSK